MKTCLDQCFWIFFFHPETHCSNNTYPLELVISGTLFKKQWSNNLKSDSEWESADGQKHFLLSLGSGQGKLDQLIILAFLGAFLLFILGPIWKPETLYVCSSLCQHTRLMLSLFSQGKKGRTFHSSPCFHAQKFPCYYSGCWNFPKPVTCSVSVEQLYKICSAIFE